MTRLRRLCLISCVVSLTPACGPGSPSDTTATETTPASSSSTAAEPTAGPHPTTGGATTTTATSTSGESTGTTTAGSITEPVTSTTSTSSTTGTSTSTTTTDSTSTSGTTEPPIPAVCEAPVDCLPVFFHDENDQMTDEPSGWVKCNAGSVYYREEVLDCAHEVFWPACEGEDGDCSEDADCPGNESCRNIFGTCQCTDQCMSDSDCKDGEICMCAGRGNGGWLALKNECMPADCAGPDDCEGACGCRGSEFFCSTLEGAFCPTPEDECHDHDDCPTKRCAWEPSEQRWTCQEWGSCE